MKRMMMRLVFSLLVLSLTATAAFAKPARRAKDDPGARGKVIVGVTVRVAPAPVAKTPSARITANAAYSVDSEASTGCFGCHFMYGAFYPGTNLTEDIKFAGCVAKYCN
jgi:hypothetical protein